MCNQFQRRNVSLWRLLCQRAGQSYATHSFRLLTDIKVSVINNCALEYVATMPFQLQKGACQARLDNQVLLCFSDHEVSTGSDTITNPERKKCWKFDEENGLYKYDNAIPETVYEHQHNPMAIYDGNPLAIGGCWRLEVEMFDRIDRKWIRLDDFPNPGG